ncbi:NLR [Mactra antiquata]
MAGIASNPGTTEIYIFRYQYLLVEIGGQILRSIFDLEVGNDLVQYLQNDPAKCQKLNNLKSRGIIKGVQVGMLPPINNNPCTSEFDITLLSCLLLKICQLPPTIEADVIMIKEYRNHLNHRSSVKIDETKFDQMWEDLCKILNRLNIFAKINDLSDQIDKIKDCEIDEILGKKLEDVIKHWNESEKFVQLEVEGLKISQSELKEALSKCEETLQDHETTLQDHVTTLHDHRTTLQDHVTTLQNHGTTLQDHVTTLQDHVTTLHDHGTTLQDHGTTLHDYGTTLQDHEATLQDHVTTLHDYETTLQDHEARLQDQGTTLQDHGTTLQDHVTTLHDHGTTLQDHGTTLHDYGTTLQDHEATLQDHVTTLHDYETTLQDHEARLQDQGTTLQDHGTALQDITYQLDTIKDFDQRKQGRNDQEEIKLINDATALKTYLIKTYKETCSTLPVTALSEKDDEIELLEFYQPIKVIHKPYHRSTEDDKEYEISSFKEIFYTGEHCFKHIFLTAEAGHGKSSLCQCMTLLWSKVQADETINNNYFQENSAFMKQFDFVFHISLRDTYRDYILTMIVDLLLEFNDNEDELKKLLTYVSEQYNCLIILDGLDEWTPSFQGRKPDTLPRKLQSDKCIYLTACRPYKIETERLAPRDIDCQVHISGMNRSEYENYVNAVIQYVNKTRTVQRDVGDFFSEIERCGLSDHLRVPIITSQLILVWFKQKLTNMSRAVIYGNLVEMLIERADKKEQMKLSHIQSCDLQFPESFKEFNYIRKYAPLIEKVCLLAFRSLFKQDDNVSVLVFTSKKLMSEPYCITNEEMDFLCKLGILSKHKVIGNVGECELKLSFLHKSFIEFYAAMYVSFFDKKDDFHSVIIKWTKLIEIFEYKNFLLLLSGLCHEKVNFLLDTIYTCSSLSDDIQACRDDLKALYESDFFHISSILLYHKILLKIQDLVIKLFIEIRTHVDKNVCLKLEDFIFSYKCFASFDTKYIETLAQLLLLNKTNVKCLYIDDGIFHDEFNQICNLQHICVHIDGQYDDRFNTLMLQNKTTLHTVSFRNIDFFPEMSLSRFV